MDNNAKACYDRIVMLLATIISGHFGIPKGARDLQARTIKRMQFHVKTALGISMEYYQDDKTSLLHGSGHGSGSSAPLWLFISSIIKDCFEDIANGMEMTNMNLTIISENGSQHVRVCLSTVPRTFCTAAAPVFCEFHHGERYLPTAPPFSAQ